MTHFFFAPLFASFGEALLGIRLASDLHRAGHRVVFVGPSAIGPLVARAGVRFFSIDAIIETQAGNLPQMLKESMDQAGSASLTLVDLASTYKACAAFGMSFSALVSTSSRTKVLAIDPWNLQEAGLIWDYGPEDYHLGQEVLSGIPRLVPVPFVRPSVEGGYDALPHLQPISTAERDYLRAELGLQSDERLILWATARWQSPEEQPSAQRNRLARSLPHLICGYVSALGPKVRMLHIGPEPLNGPGVLGTRYIHLNQQEPTTFGKLLQAADLLLTCNAAATTLGTAIAGRLPVLLLTNSKTYAHDTDGKTENLGALPALFLHQTKVVPPLYAWPLSLARFLTPVLLDNPCYDTIAKADLMDQEGVLESAKELLFSQTAADAQRHKEALYETTVRKLRDPVSCFLTNVG